MDSCCPPSSYGFVTNHGCSIKFAGTDVIYTGPAIPAAGISNGDNFDVVMQKVQAYILANNTL